jgi:hypothetical protein
MIEDSLETELDLPVQMLRNESRVDLNLAKYDPEGNFER